MLAFIRALDASVLAGKLSRTTHREMKLETKGNAMNRRAARSALAVVIGLCSAANAIDCPNSSAWLAPTLYVGTKGTLPNGKGAIWKFQKNAVPEWTMVSPPNWDVAAVMDMVMFNGGLYVGTQSLHGYGGTPASAGAVWRYEGGNWTVVSPLPRLDTSAMTLQVHAGALCRHYLCSI